MEVKILRLGKEDADKFVSLIVVFEDAFEMKNFQAPQPDYLKALLAQPQFIVYVAIDSGIVVGGLTAHILPSYYSRPPVVYIYDLAVKRGYQRKGIGKMLIAHIKNDCENAGMQEIFVQANMEDSHAIDFYRLTGGIPESVIHFSYPLKH
jgi:aminoglycoside 3-N-acetyltransferase I